MATPRHFKPADFDAEPAELEQFCVATIDWTTPSEWDEDDNPPLGAAERNDALYLLVRDHWRKARKNTIEYVGMTTALPTRFREHRCAGELREMRGTTLLSVGNVTFSGKGSRWAREKLGLSLRQIEHILIWALPPPLRNIQGQYVLPVLSGKNVAHAKPWIIRNEGHRFHGRMPREIVFPWMIIKHGRDRSQRTKAKS
jgi:hypothetical protein